METLCSRAPELMVCERGELAPWGRGPVCARHPPPSTGTVTINVIPVFPCVDSVVRSTATGSERLGGRPCPSGPHLPASTPTTRGEGGGSWDSQTSARALLRLRTSLVSGSRHHQRTQFSARQCHGACVNLDYPASLSGDPICYGQSHTCLSPR